jgi:hypothetical protein
MALDTLSCAKLVSHQLPDCTSNSLGNTRRYFCDLLGSGGKEENEEAAIYVALAAARLSRSGSRCRRSANPPPCASTEQESRSRDILHSAVESKRLPTYSLELSTVPSARSRTIHSQPVVGCEHFSGRRITTYTEALLRWTLTNKA